MYFGKDVTLKRVVDLDFAIKSNSIIRETRKIPMPLDTRNHSVQWRMIHHRFEILI